ncbi:MAG: hypothetical protein KC619_20060 [Myxococcales bacterium]|nr:hypothetical protein [Myxococcales bacterium]
MNMRDDAQDQELGEHESRLDELEDRLSATFPAPDTQAGAAQRFRFEVPTPSTVFTLGARGSSTSDGQAIGPGGVAFRTVESLAAEIRLNAILDVAGVTTFHSDGGARLLTLADLGLSGDTGVRVGTQTGDVELTAGHVGHPDPSFTVVPSMDVPPPAEVDTAGPRSATESSRGVWDAVWTGIKVADTAQSVYEWFTSFVDPPVGYSPPSIEPHAARVIQGALVALSVFRGMVVPAIEAAVSAAEAAQGGESSEPMVRVHGAGGVEVSSPEKVRLFGIGGAKLDSPSSASVAGGLSAKLESPTKAQVYGGLMAALKSEVVAKVSARFALLSGEYAEVKGKEAAAVSSNKDTTIAGGQNVVIDSRCVAVGGTYVHASSHVETKVSSSQSVKIEGGRQVESKVENAKVTVDPGGVCIEHLGAKIDVNDDGGIRIDPGGGMHLRIDRTGMRSRLLRFTRGEMTLRGRVNLG